MTSFDSKIDNIERLIIQAYETPENNALVSEIDEKITSLSKIENLGFVKANLNALNGKVKATKITSENLGALRNEIQVIKEIVSKKEQDSENLLSVTEIHDLDDGLRALMTEYQLTDERARTDVADPKFYSQPIDSRIAKKLTLEELSLNFPFSDDELKEANGDHLQAFAQILERVGMTPNELVLLDQDSIRHLLSEDDLKATNGDNLAAFVGMLDRVGITNDELPLLEDRFGISPKIIVREGGLENAMKKEVALLKTFNEKMGAEVEIDLDSKLHDQLRSLHFGIENPELERMGNYVGDVLPNKIPHLPGLKINWAPSGVTRYISFNAPVSNESLKEKLKPIFERALQNYCREYDISSSDPNLTLINQYLEKAPLNSIAKLFVVFEDNKRSPYALNVIKWEIQT